MVELPVSASAIQHFERLLDAAANGGTLRCVEQGGSRIYYVKQALRSNQDFLNKILYGKPGPGGTSAPVLRLVVDHDAGQVGAREHVDSNLPGLFSSAPAEALKLRASLR